MSRKLLSIVYRVILGFCIIVFVTFTFVELMLRTVDPLGLAYFDDLYTFYNNVIETPDGYALPPGTHVLSHWSYTANADGTRVVPDNGAGDTVLFVGDSFTFGWGVNDSETWVSIAARDLDIHAINAGFPGINAAQVRQQIARYPDVDHIVYLHFHNDDWPPLVLRRDAATLDAPYTNVLQPPPLRLLTLLNPPMAQYTDIRDPGYANTMRVLAADPRVLMLALDDWRGIGRQTATDYGATLLAYPTSTISYYDGHADVAGNAEIASRVADVVRAWMR